MTNKNNSKGLLMAADFLTYTVKAFMIGIVTSVVLSGAVILVAHSTNADEVSLKSDTPAIRAAR